MSARPWTKAETALLRKLASTATVPELAKLFGRSEHAIRTKLYVLNAEYAFCGAGLKAVNAPTPEEIAEQAAKIKAEHYAR